MNKVDNKDAILLYLGIIMGAILGVFGSVYANYFYETNKNEPWFNSSMLGIGLTFFAFLFIMLFMVIRWSIQLRNNARSVNQKIETEHKMNAKT